MCSHSCSMLLPTVAQGLRSLQLVAYIPKGSPAPAPSQRIAKGQRKHMALGGPAFGPSIHTDALTGPFHMAGKGGWEIQSSGAWLQSHFHAKR